MFLLLPLKAFFKKLPPPDLKFKRKKKKPKHFKLDTRLEHLVYCGKFIIKTAIAYPATYKIII